MHYRKNEAATEKVPTLSEPIRTGTTVRRMSQIIVILVLYMYETFVC